MFIDHFNLFAQSHRFVKSKRDMVIYVTRKDLSTFLCFYRVSKKFVVSPYSIHQSPFSDRLRKLDRYSNGIVDKECGH